MLKGEPLPDGEPPPVMFTLDAVQDTLEGVDMVLVQALQPKLRQPLHPDQEQSDPAWPTHMTDHDQFETRFPLKIFSTPFTRQQTSSHSGEQLIKRLEDLFDANGLK